ncbi:MAG: DUF4783 domain-containing protein [Rhodothermales bacterium]
MRPATGILVLLLWWHGLAPDAIAQENETESPAVPTAFQQVMAAFERGDVDALIRRCADRVDLSLFGDGELLSKSQAKYVMREFFRDYPPQELDVEETSSTEGSWFASGIYRHRSGNPLSIYFRLRSSDGNWELREIRFAGRVRE